MSRPLNQGDLATTSRIEHQKSGVWYYDTISALITLVTASLTSSYRTVFTTQRSSPATGATVAVTDSSADTHLILTPAGTIATLTVNFPAGGTSGNAIDKQEVLITSQQIVTTLTLGANGATAIVGDATTIGAGGFLRYKYDSQFHSWIRIG